MLDFFHLECIELDWSVATKHADHDLKLALSGVDFAYSAVEAQRPCDA